MFVLRADLFLKISLLMFADLLYILVDKTSKKLFNLVSSQLKLFCCQKELYFLNPHLMTTNQKRAVR